MTSFDRLWRCHKVTPPSTGVQRGPQGNLIPPTMPGIIEWVLDRPYKTNEKLLIWKTAAGWTAQITGTEGKEVTDRLPQERWEEIASQAQAVFALTGDVGLVPKQEIL